MAKKESFNNSIQSVDKGAFIKKALIIAAVTAIAIAVLYVVHLMLNKPAEEAPPAEAPAPAMVPSDIRYYDPAEEETYETGVNYVLLNQSNGNSIRVGADGSVYVVDENGRIVERLTGQARLDAIDQALNLGKIDSSVMIALGDLERPETAPQLSEADLEKQREAEIAEMLENDFNMSLDDFYSLLYSQDVTPDYFYEMLDNGADAGQLISMAVDMGEKASKEEGEGTSTALAAAMEGTVQEEESSAIEYPSWMQPIDMDASMTAMMDSLNSAIASTNQGSQREQDWEATNQQGQKREWLEAQQSGEMSADGRIGPYDLVAGTVVPITIVTGINTDLPGDVVGLVRQNVYDTLTGRNILIPKGTRLMATYNSSVSFGQHSVQVAWNQMITPDGYVYTLPGFQGVTGEGYAGVSDKYDNHFWEILGGAALGSIINIATGYAREQAAALDSVANMNGWAELIANGVLDESEDLAEDYIDRLLDRQPTITIRPGHQTQLLVNRTINLAR